MQMHYLEFGITDMTAYTYSPLPHYKILTQQEKS